MCGIVGAIAKNTRFPTYMDEVFTEMLMMDSIRGEDSTGVFGVTSGNKVDILKGNGNGYQFTACTQYTKWKNKMYNSYQIAIGHNRKATKGNITPENAHPFNEGHIYLVHNGVMRNADSVDKTVEVDSMAIAKALQQHDAVAGLGKIDGAYALAWYDQNERTLNLARNVERPLFLVEYDDTWVISSEVGLPFWLMQRRNHKPKGYRLIETRKILVFSLDDLKSGPKEVPFEEFSHFKYTPVVTPYVAPKPKLTPTPSYNTAPAYSPSTPKLGAGERVLVKIRDYSSQDGVTCLIGNPVFDGEVDKNISVRVSLRSGEVVLPYIEAAEKSNTLFECTVQFWRQMSGLPLLFANKPTALITTTDATKEESSISELQEALAKNNCKRCDKPMNIADISQSIARKTATGTWRLLCKVCLKDSQDRAEISKQDRALHAVH